MTTGDTTTPTLAALRRARARQEAALRWLRPVGLAVALLVVARAFRSSPPPGWHGAGLGILAAAGTIIAGAVGAVASYRGPGPLQAAFFTLFLAGSVAISWLQPGGAGLLGALVAVGVMTRRLPVRLTAVPVALTLVVIGVAGVAGRMHHPAPSLLLIELGLIAMYCLGLLTRRVCESTAQAERLLLELEQTRGAEVRAAALAERQRLAREMHDVLAHALSGLALQLEGARLLAAEDPADPRLGDVIDRAHHLARTGVQEARWAIGMLRSDELPGPQRLAALVAEFERDSGIPSRFAVTGGQRTLSAGLRLALYRVAQEALTNVRKHSHPDRVEVGLAYEPGGVSLRVEDFGAAGGPLPASAAGGPGSGPGAAGYGLTGMRERAELLGGSLSAAPTSLGFRVTMQVPA